MNGVGFAVGIGVGWSVVSAAWLPDGTGFRHGLATTEISSWLGVGALL